MGIKNTASEERLFCLRGLSEGDTILFGVSISSENLIETYWRMFRPMTVPVGAGAVFIFLNFSTFATVTPPAQSLKIIFCS